MSVSVDARKNDESLLTNTELGIGEITSEYNEVMDINWSNANAAYVLEKLGVKLEGGCAEIPPEHLIERLAQASITEIEDIYVLLQLDRLHKFTKEAIIRGADMIDFA